MKRTFVLAIFFCLMTSVSAYAVMIEGNGGLGYLTGDMSYSAEGGTSATLTITLTNKSTNGGYLTGFVFNLPGPMTVDSGGGDFSTLLGGKKYKDSINANPYGKFDIGAGASKKYAKAKNKNGEGLPVGQTGSYTITFSGSGLDAYTAEDFLTDAPKSKGDPQAFVAYFNGFDKGLKDARKKQNRMSPCNGVPIPGALWLLGAGILGLIGVRNFFVKRT